ncbi:hypothetical protein [Bacillus suaedaesalsae]|uniref:DUF3221 domain-containing protein n=1 Tax=Bacillus suaedaesalsae TaxID=2810349 RepID=A0ABS2DJU5_9BACI|nr:hypothetical protein [Bacillus suaedaesalsae]MBM6618743.1 hypothetical protein [Bacillus suaedaesalsae]
MNTLKMLSVILLAGSLAACGTAVADNTNKEATGEVVNGSGDSSSKEVDGKAVVVKEEAAFVGQIDTNSIEVNTETETLVLQVGNVTDIDWNSIEKNAHVTIEYYKNREGQAILQSIDVKEIKKEQNGENKGTMKEEAAYVGQIDSNSIEVNTESRTLALQIGGVKDVNWSKIKKNAAVVVEYYQNEENQYILTKIIVKEESKSEAKNNTIREEAAYVGQLDSNSIEVNTEMKKMTLRTEQVKDVNWSKIDKNAHVIVEYYKNDKGQYVLTKIEVK